MAKHTPAPWTIVRYGDGDSLVIHADSESRICFMATPGSMGDPEKIAADAALIAASPDLLEALEGLLAAYDEERQAIDVSADPHCPDCTHNTTPDSFGRKTCAFHLARSVVARATQGSPQ